MNITSAAAAMTHAVSPALMVVATVSLPSSGDKSLRTSRSAVGCARPRPPGGRGVLRSNRSAGAPGSGHVDPRLAVQQARELGRLARSGEPVALRPVAAEPVQ